MCVDSIDIITPGRGVYQRMEFLLAITNYVGIRSVFGSFGKLD